jgi:hypothetical protein
MPSVLINCKDVGFLCLHAAKYMLMLLMPWWTKAAWGGGGACFDTSLNASLQCRVAVFACERRGDGGVNIA